MKGDVKKPKDPRIETERYRQNVLRAIGEGKDQLALCWRLVMDAAQNFWMESQQKEVISSASPLFVEELATLMKATQEAHYRSRSAGVSFSFLTPHWIFETGILKEAAMEYRYWMSLAQAKNSSRFQREIIMQATEAVRMYQQLIPKVAFFAAEAVTCFKRAQKIQQHARGESSFASNLTLYRWLIAAHAALHAAERHFHLHTVMACKNPILITHWNEAAHAAEHAFYFRIKAAEATQEGNEVTAMDWSLAAYAANNIGATQLKLLELFPLGNQELIDSWSEALQPLGTAMRKRKEAAMVLGKERESLAQIAFWNECHYDFIEKVLEVSSYKNRYAQQQWKEMLSASHALLIRLEESNKTGICSIQKKLRRKIVELLIQKIFFYIPEELLLKKEALKEEAIPETADAPEIKYNTFHSWIRQTWTLCKENNVFCKCTADINEKGIIIMAGGMIISAEKKIPPADIFLVDIVADNPPNPLAHFYILQNRALARFFPNSLFMPHWPQPGLIPRDSARGDCFENICFFGDSIHNLAPELQSPSWQERLKKELGMTFSIRAPGAWHDYSDVDCVIGVRDFSSSRHFHKPATKLYNAWLAGVPFIGGRDSAYRADGHPGRDYLVATSVEHVFEHLKRLKEDKVFRAMLVENGLQAGHSFSKEATLARWKKLFEETLPARAVRWQKKSRWERSLFLQTQRLFCWLDRLFKRL